MHFWYENYISSTWVCPVDFWVCQVQSWHTVTWPRVLTRLVVIAFLVCLFFLTRALSRFVIFFLNLSRKGLGVIWPRLGSAESGGQNSVKGSGKLGSEGWAQSQTEWSVFGSHCHMRPLDSANHSQTFKDTSFTNKTGMFMVHISNWFNWLWPFHLWHRTEIFHSKIKHRFYLHYLYHYYVSFWISIILHPLSASLLTRDQQIQNNHFAEIWGPHNDTWSQWIGRNTRAANRKYGISGIKLERGCSVMK